MAGTARRKASKETCRFEMIREQKRGGEEEREAREGSTKPRPVFKGVKRTSVPLSPVLLDKTNAGTYYDFLDNFIIKYNKNFV